MVVSSCSGSPITDINEVLVDELADEALLGVAKPGSKLSKIVIFQVDRLCAELFRKYKKDCSKPQINVPNFQTLAKFIASLLTIFCRYYVVK